MSEQKHTAEPWGPIGGDHVGLVSGLRLAKFWMESDRDRAIACFNAMQGIADPAAAMAKCREALQVFAQMATAYRDTASGSLEINHDFKITLADCRAAREALVALGGAK